MVTAGSQLQLTVVAHDTFPGTPLTFSLAPGAPGNASINPTTGVFTWTPVIPQTTTFTVRVADNSTPPLVTTQTFTVMVHGLKPVVSAGGNVSIRVANTLSRGGSFTIPIYEHVTATVGYGDGSGVKPLTLTAAKTFSLSHKYAKTGRYTVLVTIKDQLATSERQAVVTANGRERSRRTVEPRDGAGRAAESWRVSEDKATETWWAETVTEG